MKFESNQLDVDPRFDASESVRFPLPDDSSAYQVGFQRIPLEQIGLRTKGKK